MYGGFAVTGPALPTRPLSRTELIAIDCLLAVLLAAGYLGVALPDAESPGRVWAACVAVALMSLPIAVRRLWPIPVFVVVLAASVLALASGLLYEPFIAAALASYTAAVAERRLTRRGWAVLGCASVLLVLVSVSAGVAGSWARPLAVLLPGLALVAAMWTAGVAVRERRAYAARSNAERTARAVADERLRIAREVHDIVTHNLGIIAVKAAVARHVSGARPDEAQDALRVIEEISRAALTEMRQVLRVLRTAEPAELQPVGGDLHSLVERAEAAGLDVRYEATGADQLPEGAALSAYRAAKVSPRAGLDTGKHLVVAFSAGNHYHVRLPARRPLVADAFDQARHRGVDPHDMDEHDVDQSGQLVEQAHHDVQ
jgi:signal transduction histidine kinase